MILPLMEVSMKSGEGQTELNSDQLTPLIPVSSSQKFGFRANLGADLVSGLDIH